ncbi:surface-adhesin E family protein [Noviherbaspirillum humi]|uniref:surface-adhesin E family protein n=1 Tax=Noviherbaspirillum humi TaxID=1688639 RepID=UPI0011603B01|nr:surface-adhesin E family protein [Noviherbaspirillum humi]
MKMIFLLAALTVVPAWAAWTPVATHDAADIYVDPATIKTAGDTRRVWMLADFKERGPGGELSLRSYVEVDCSKHATRQLKGFGHEESMAQGKLVFNAFKPGNWAPVAEGPGEAVVKAVCRS